MATYKVEIECLFLKKPWLVKMSAGNDPVYTFKRQGWRPWREVRVAEIQALHASGGDILDHVVGAVAVNPWPMRERLFDVKTPEDALVFLRDYGLWRYSRFDGDESDGTLPMGWAEGSEAEPMAISFSDLIYQRDLFESALAHGPTEWLRLTRGAGRHPKSFEDAESDTFRASSEMAYMFGGTINGPKVTLGLIPEVMFPGPFQGRITCHDVQDAIRATVLLDWMEGREWPQCANRDCRRRFKRTSKHPQLYCGSKCATKVRQERFRNGKQ